MSSHFVALNSVICCLSWTALMMIYAHRTVCLSLLLRLPPSLPPSLTPSIPHSLPPSLPSSIPPPVCLWCNDFLKCGSKASLIAAIFPSLQCTTVWRRYAWVFLCRSVALSLFSSPCIIDVWNFRLPRLRMTWPRPHPDRTVAITTEGRLSSMPSVRTGDL